jgi:hypothetical protein
MVVGDNTYNLYIIWFLVKSISEILYKVFNQSNRMTKKALAILLSFFILPAIVLNHSVVYIRLAEC